MAAADFISSAGSKFEDALCELRSLMSMCDQLSSENSPEWLFVFGRHIAAVSETADAYIVAVNHQAMPILRDVEKISKTV
jgi:hypothetical protein